MSLAPIAKRLGRLIEKEVRIAPDSIGTAVQDLVGNLVDGDVLLLENLRFHSEEQANDDEFARELASLCDIYINNAFAVSHREHASVVAITKFAPQSAAGFLLIKELDYFHSAMDNPRRPLVAIVGGAKVSSKLGALKNMLSRVNKFIIGGAMANTFLKSQGFNLGKSLVEEDLVEEAGEIMKQAISEGEDYELLFTVKAENWRAVEKLALDCDTPLTRIGQVVVQPGLRLFDNGHLATEPLVSWQHF